MLSASFYRHKRKPTVMLGLPTNNHTSASSLISDGMDSFSPASFKRNVQFF